MHDVKTQTYCSDSRKKTSMPAV